MSDTALLDTPPEAAFVSWATSLRNRDDAYGTYGSDGGAFTAKTAADGQVLTSHVRGLTSVGLHAIGQDNTSRFVAWDFDNHEESPAKAERNREQALQLWTQLREMGAEPVLEDSDGQGGYHVLVQFDEPVPSTNAHAWARALAPAGCEFFPKQPAIEENGYGSWLRLPGRHPRRDHWSAIWDGSRWVSWPECVDLLGDALRCPAALVPEAPAEGRSTEETSTEAIGSHRNNLLALHALLRLSPSRADDYDSWLKVGMALKAVDPDLMLTAWTFWSRQSSKFTPGECAEKWSTFTKKDNGVGLGSLLHWAQGDNYRPPVANEEDRQARLRELNAKLSTDGRPVCIERIVRRGGVNAAVDFQLANGINVTIGRLSALGTFSKVRTALIEGANLILPKKLGKEWDDIGQLAIDCVEKLDGESEEDETRDLLESLLQSHPPINADEREQRETLRANPRMPFFEVRGRLHVRLQALVGLLRTSGLGTFDRRGVADRLTRMGWSKARPSIGPRGERERVTSYAAPEDWDR